MLEQQSTANGLALQAQVFAEPHSYMLAVQALCMLGTQPTPPDATAPRRGLADWQVNRVTRYMQEHLDEQIGLDQLAALVRLSRWHFCTAFRQATGYTPYDWLVARRIERAQELLTTTDMPVTEIALAVGYQTPSSFSASFRKVVGVTPSSYRRTLGTPGQERRLPQMHRHGGTSLS